jgi:L-malate glycosyltransferase
MSPWIKAVSRHILVLTPYLYGTAPGPRSSFELWERVLREADIELHYAEFETPALHAVVYGGNAIDKIIEMSRAYARFVTKLRDLDQYDAVLVNREAALIGPPLIERWIAHRRKPLIYWLDDPLYIPYRSPSSGVLSYLKFFGKVKTLCRISAGVMTNSPSHTAFARRYNDRVCEIPSLVDADLYTGWRPRAGNGRVCVGWTGSSSTAGNLQLIREPLERLAAREDVELRFIGAPQFDLPGVRYTAQEWCAETEVDDLRRFDVGLLPVPPSPWAPHKFYMKLVQYMALGIPPVASAMGCNPSVIDEGESGFLSRDPRDWESAVSQLVQDADLRERMGRRAAEVAHQRYTLQANADKILNAFEAVVGR